MSLSLTQEKKYQKRIKDLEDELEKLKGKRAEGDTVTVPKEIKPLFDKAQLTVGEYFKNLKFDPSHGTIQINDQRYVLVRAAALSIDFLESIRQLYADKGIDEAYNIGKNFLFDISHTIGINDAHSFHEKMNLKDPISKLSAGPVHFAYTGWAFVEILPQSNPAPNDDYFLIYNHPYSFEASSWISAGKKSDFPVCIMNSGYSSGWCEASYGMPLTSVELTCKAKGDEQCTFIMAPPHKIKEHLSKYISERKESEHLSKFYVPTFFERKNIEEGLYFAKIKAEEALKVKSAFLANMSHEIRTPLNAILGYADLILNENPRKEHLDYLHTIHESGKHLLELVNDILDLSKMESGQLIIKKEACSLRRILKNIESNANALIHRYDKKIALNTLIPEEVLDDLMLDETRLKQILNNLLSNAIKFTETGTVKFGIEKVLKGHLIFFVEDTGIGIPKQRQKEVFGVFNQIDSSYTRKYGGSGLGLNICKKLINQLGGELTLKSFPNKGSKFIFTIPYVPVRMQEEVDKVPPLKIAEKILKKILLVDDNLINQKLTKIILEKAGFEVITANDGKDGLSKFCSTIFDAVLMDIQMPVMDGLVATKLIRGHEKKKSLNRTPVIAFTAHAMKEDMERCFEAGCDTYFTKPVIIADLIVEIKKLTANRK